MQIQYTTLSQNDKQGIDYVKKDYNKDPAKGLTHGLQKDAIQNSVGASQTKKFKDWKITFELTVINGKDALIFTDQGTTGLIGEILTQDEIMRRKSEDKLRDDDHLSRFRTVFNSGGNEGPGSYGRGKLVFQACSSTNTILCDSLRKSDNKYIAFKRTINKLQLQESQVFQEKNAKIFIKEETGDKIKPLENFGTRIIVLDLDSAKQKNELSIKESFLKSFDEHFRDDECELSFDKMIQETWWELILKCGVNITLKDGKHEKKVELSEPLKTIVNVKNNESGWKVYDKRDIPFDFDGMIFKIKQLKFVVSPKGQTLPENFQKITTQRKKMKIGAIKRIIPHAQIKKNFTGFLILDESLEGLLLPPEDMTHYGYDHMGVGILKRIKSEIETNLNKFQKELGLSTEGENGTLSKTLNEVLKDINDQAKELGLLASSGIGRKRKNFQIKINDFPLPRVGQLRIEYEDKIGKIKFSVKNLMSRKFSGKINAVLTQENNPHVQPVFENTCELQINKQAEFEIPKFQVDSAFYYGSKILFKISIENESFNATRYLWLGIEPQKKSSDQLLKLINFNIDFPRRESRRVEIDESIKNLRFCLVNLSAYNIETKVSVLIKRIHREDTRNLETVLTTVDTVTPLAEIEKEIKEINICEDVFGFFQMEVPPTKENRKCRLEITALANKDYPELRILEGENLIQTKKIDFYVGIDDPGMSIFKRVEEVKNDPYNRRSFYEDEGDGYVFILNSGHPFFKKMAAYPELQEEYIKEEMLKAAYNICIKQESFSAVFDEDSFLNEPFSKTLIEEQDKNDLFNVYENLLSQALYKTFMV